MEIKPDIETTADGSATLRHPVCGETYHSLRGAVGESMHVFIHAGLEFVAGSFAGEAIRVFEVGFGSGLNAWLTLDYARQNGLRVEYTAVELYPVGRETVGALGYTPDQLFGALHDAPWGDAVRVAEGFTLRKVEGDFTRMELAGPFDVVYFDAFAPDVQPELWSSERFAAIARAIRPGGVLVTYSAKGMVKRNLRDAGFEVHRLPGALGKRHMLRAVKK